MSAHKPKINSSMQQSASSTASGIILAPDDIDTPCPTVIGRSRGWLMSENKTLWAFFVPLKANQENSLPKISMVMDSDETGKNIAFRVDVVKQNLVPGSDVNIDIGYTFIIDNITTPDTYNKIFEQIITIPSEASESVDVVSHVAITRIAATANPHSGKVAVFNNGFASGPCWNLSPAAEAEKWHSLEGALYADVKISDTYKKIILDQVSPTEGSPVLRWVALDENGDPVGGTYDYNGSGISNNSPFGGDTSIPSTNSSPDALNNGSMGITARGYLTKSKVYGNISVVVDHLTYDTAHKLLGGKTSHESPRSTQSNVIRLFWSNNSAFASGSRIKF